MKRWQVGDVMTRGVVSVPPTAGYQEIADLLGCPLSTVKTRLYQGLSVLRRELAKTAAGPKGPALRT